MSHKKVKMACGMFDLVSPSYGRPSITLAGPLLRTDNAILDRHHAPEITREIAAIKDTRAFIKSVAAFKRQAPPFDPRPVLRAKCGFRNTPTLVQG